MAWDDEYELLTQDNIYVGQELFRKPGGYNFSNKRIVTEISRNGFKISSTDRFGDTEKISRFWDQGVNIGHNAYYVRKHVKYSPTQVGDLEDDL